jgi:hypothetical protein
LELSRCKRVIFVAFQIKGLVGALWREVSATQGMVKAPPWNAAPTIHVDMLRKLGNACRPKLLPAEEPASPLTKSRKKNKGGEKTRGNQACDDIKK